MQHTIIVDTEYTTWPGALESGWSQPGQQREIVQIAAIRVDSSFREVGSLDILVRPLLGPELSALFVELTGIDQANVDACGMPFSGALERFLGFCEDGRLPIICMNADEAVFRENCRINTLDFPLEQSWHRLRPFLEERGLDLAQLSSGDLHTLTRTPLSGHVHNALHDVRSMACWLRDALEKGVFHGLEDLPTGAPDFDPRSLRAR
jgi:inhibitor of KinA sporulation pathway (predicted exonuclease)